jgi:hypothetical protein
VHQISYFDFFRDPQTLDDGASMEHAVPTNGLVQIE